MPSLTLRENTKRLVTVTLGTNQIIGADPAQTERAVRQVLSGTWKRGTIPPLWNGRAAERIADAITAWRASS